MLGIVLICTVCAAHLGGVDEQAVSCIERSKVIEIPVELFSLLAALTVRVLLDAHDDCVDGNQDSEDAGHCGLYTDEHNTSHSLCSLSDAKLFDEDENTDDG